YSPGTSSSGTSWVRTSLSSAAAASSTPFTISASNAFPSSSSSSTLSESAPSRLVNPCKSPDCPPARDPRPFGVNVTVSTISLFPRTGLFRALAVFPAAFFLLPALTFTLAFFGTDFFCGNFFLGAAFLPAIRFVCFFLDFFLVAIGEVYHLSDVYGAHAAPSHRGSLQTPSSLR